MELISAQVQKYFLRPLLVVGLFGLISLATISPTYADTNQQVINNINSQRQSAGLKSLNLNSKLTQAAQNHNQLMVKCSETYGKNSCFSHQIVILNEPSLMDRIQETNYNPQAVAENIAWGYSSSTSVVNAWMNSSGHRANILNSNYQDIGCAYNSVGNWWTCDFGRSFKPQIILTPTPILSIPTKIPTHTPTPTPKLTSTPILGVKITPTNTPISRHKSLTSVSIRNYYLNFWCQIFPDLRFCQNYS